MIVAVACAFAFDAAAALRTDPAKVAAMRDGVELLYARRYPEASVAFEDIGRRYPTSGIGPLGLAILYQERMFENEDLRYEGAYATARDATRAQVELGLAAPGDEALENFVLAGIQGLEAIHLVRKESYVSALGRAYEALRALARCEEAAPQFVDAELGDGMFLFWRTVVAQRSPLIPDFADRREEGLAHLRKVEAEGVFLGPAASLALAVAYVELKHPEDALAKTDALAKRYPGNVINQLYRYHILLSLHRPEEAAAAVAALDPVAVPRVWYYRGLAAGRLHHWEDAARAYQAYLGTGPTDREQVAQAWYRLGDALARAGNLPGARSAMQQAADLGHKPAKKALARWDGAR